MERSQRAPAVVIGAESQVGTLAGCFAVAVVIVSPFGYRRVRAVRRHRAERVAASAPPEAVTPVDDLNLASSLAAIAADVAAREPGEAFAVSLPVLATLGGRTADRAIVESIVADSLRRDGIEIVERSGDTWRCRRPK
jgi:hypothetical protein